MAYFNLFFLVVLGLADSFILVAVKVLWDLLGGEDEHRGFIFLFFVVVLGLIGALGFLEWIWFTETFK
jgi:hypothetical protein